MSHDEGPLSQGPLTKKEVDNGYSVLGGPKTVVSKPVDNHAYFILECKCIHIAIYKCIII